MACKQGSAISNNPGETADNGLLVRKIENAYRIYKMSEIYMNDVADDYGKQKIARLRYEFAQHELMLLIQEAARKGVKWDNCELPENLFYTER
jgi:hypothetical protein